MTFNEFKEQLTMIEPYDFDVFSPYKSHSNSPYVIKSVHSSNCNIRFPESLDGHRLAEINSHAFDNFKDIQLISLPAGLTSFYEAFSDCSQLKAIWIPKSVKRISKSAFQNCNMLMDIFYEGTKQEWDMIGLFSGNDEVEKANIHFECRWLDGK